MDDAAERPAMRRPPARGDARVLPATRRDAAIAPRRRPTRRPATASRSPRAPARPTPAHDRAGCPTEPADDRRCRCRARLPGPTGRRAVPGRRLADRAAARPASTRPPIDAAVDVAFGPRRRPVRRALGRRRPGRLDRLRALPPERSDRTPCSRRSRSAKSFTSAIIGLLVDDGALTLDEHPPRPEWPAGDPRAAITLRQLLQMSSGLEWTEEYGPRQPGPARCCRRPSAAARDGRPAAGAGAGLGVRVLDGHVGADRRHRRRRARRLRGARHLPPRAAARPDRHHDRADHRPTAAAASSAASAWT